MFFDFWYYINDYTIILIATQKPTAASIVAAIFTLVAYFVSLNPSILNQDEIEPTISLNTNSLELINSDEYDIEAIISPDDYDIKWNSDNEDIITVDNNGHLKTISEGNAIITASIICKNVEYTDTCNVSVKNPVINLDSTCLLYIGENKSLSATTIPEKANILWSSSNPDIVIVNDNGKIEGITEGTATITAMMIYNNVCYSEDCAITVKVLIDNNDDLSDNDQNNIQLDEQEIIGSSRENKIEDGRTPLSSAIFIRNNQLHGYMINSNYSTLQGDGFFEGYIATSAGLNYDEVISICNYSPFELIYNLEGNYNKLTGEIAFDDINITQNDIIGVTSLFKGEAEVVFYVDGVEKDRVILLSTDFPKTFAIDVSGGEQLSITFSFPYSNFVLENFDKYFNIINAYLE